MADNPKKVGVYDAGTTAGGAADTGPKPKVEVQRTGRSGTPWWAIGLVLLAIIIALVILT